tara:strand:+ start:245 stop:940 length:696 start_codon:yes stop_codon:yes gene_type:complete
MHPPIRIFTPGLEFAYNSGTSTWILSSISPGNGGFQDYKFGANTSTGFTIDAYQNVDLSGLLRQSKTLNPLSYLVSQWAPPIAVAAPVDGVGTPIQLLLTNTWSTATIPQRDPFNDNSFDWSIDDGKDYENLLGQHTQTWTSTSTTAGMQQLFSDTIGTLSKTALQKLYFVHSLGVSITQPASLAGAPSFSNGDLIQVFPSVVTIAQEVEDESTTQYVMRLAQTYDDLTAP